ncbi:MAG: DUF177 domain-containing protein [Candidatus Hydrogenedentes bacterium]|nr:DUF177 domain-containing protein [Candidatus Hydrogenedentota bacterium]
MNVLEVALSSISPEGTPFSRVVGADVVRPANVRDLDLGPVTVSGVFSHVDAEYIFHGRVSGTFLGICDRCLCGVEKPFDAEVIWVFVHGSARSPLEEFEDDEDEEFDEDSGVIMFEGVSINLAPATWDEVVLALPAKMLCNDDCAGLCPQCGANLNTAPCGCVPEPESGLSETGLKGLADMFPDLKKKPNRLED